MRKIRRVIAFAIACAGVLTTLFVSPATAGTNSWTPIGPVAEPFAVDPKSPFTIYALAGNNSVAKTIDGGAHWTDVAKFEFIIYSLVIDPASPATIYAAGGEAWDIDDSPIYKSVDGGAHWTAIPKNSDGRYVGVMAIAPSMTSTLYAGGADLIFRSVDGGLSWTKRSNGLTGWQSSALAVDPTNADVVYAAQLVFVGAFKDSAKIFKSSDGGGQWREVPIPFTDPGRSVITSLAIDPATPSIVYAAYGTCDEAGCNRGGGVFKSIDGGETWFAAQDGLSGAGYVYGLAIDPSAPAQIYVATRNGVFRSTDAAASWTPINAGLAGLQVWGIAIDRTGSILRAATAKGLFEFEIFAASSSETVPVIEYYHAPFDDYFITANPHEIRMLDNGAFAGWARTGLQFNAYAAPNVNSTPVCRFFGAALGSKSTHFFTPFAAECAATQADAAWTLESTDAFDIGVPAADGSCAAGMMPVYRLYNNGQGGAPGHRYTTDVGVRAQMVGQGWVAEGLGPDAVEMCSPL